MVNENHSPANQRTPSEPGLDRALDAALAKYAAAEPRAGLEDRILAHLQHANLQAESTRAANHKWWHMRWGWAAVAVIFIFIFAVTLTLRSSKPSQPSVKNIPAITAPTRQKPEAKKQGQQLANRDENTAPSRRGPVRHGVPTQPEAVADAYPKLDKFPSPHPLSEQEKMLLEYVQQNPEEAAMIAQAQTKFARQQELERNAPAPGDANPQMREQLE